MILRKCDVCGAVYESSEGFVSVSIECCRVKKNYDLCKICCGRYGYNRMANKPVDVNRMFCDMLGALVSAPAPRPCPPNAGYPGNQTQDDF